MINQSADWFTKETHHLPHPQVFISLIAISLVTEIGTLINNCHKISRDRQARKSKRSGEERQPTDVMGDTFLAGEPTPPSPE